MWHIELLYRNCYYSHIMSHINGLLMPFCSSSLTATGLPSGHNPRKGLLDGRLHLAPAPQSWCHQGSPGELSWPLGVGAAQCSLRWRKIRKLWKPSGVYNQQPIIREITHKIFPTHLWNHPKKTKTSSTNGSVSKPCTPSVHIKIAGKWMFIPLKWY